VNVLTEQRKISRDELAQNNGKEGKPAYIAFKGVVYEVSESAFWMEGDHMGAHDAGKDLTEEIELAPHREETLQRVKQVGSLV
jgi:predicted heme/steroid binding protein